MSLWSSSSSNTMTVGRLLTVRQESIFPHSACAGVKAIRAQHQYEVADSAREGCYWPPCSWRKIQSEAAQREGASGVTRRKRVSGRHPLTARQCAGGGGHRARQGPVTPAPLRVDEVNRKAGEGLLSSTAASGSPLPSRHPAS